MLATACGVGVSPSDFTTNSSSRYFFFTRKVKGTVGVKGDRRTSTEAVKMNSNSTKSATTASATKSKSSSRKARDGKSTPPPLKVVIRRLPHQLKEEEFLVALTSVAAEAKLGERVDAWDLVHFAPGKMSKKRGRVTSTAYLSINRGRGFSADLSLIKLRAAVLACEALAGPAAKDGKSGEKVADAYAGPMVVAAPFQKLFKQKPKRDIRVGTIEKDAEFKAFCAALKSPPPPLPSADVQVDMKESEGKEEPKRENALLDFLKERGTKKRRDGQRSAVGGSSSTGSAARGTRRGPSPTSGNGGSTTGSMTVNTVTVLRASTVSASRAGTASTNATKSKLPPSSSSANASSTSKLTAEKEPPKAQNGRSGGGSGSSNSRASRGSSSASSRTSPPPAAKEHSSESGKEAPTSSKEKSGGGRRGGGGGKARASGKSSGGGGGGGRSRSGGAGGTES